MSYTYFVSTHYIHPDISLMIKNIPSSFEYRFRRDLEYGPRRFQCLIMTLDTATSIHLSKRKDLPRDLAVSDILPGIVAQVKREVGSPFLYYSRWITRPLSHSLQFKCNEPHRYIPSYSFSGSPFSPPHLPNSSPATLSLPQRDVIPHNPDIFHHYSSGRSDGGQIINFSRN